MLIAESAETTASLIAAGAVLAGVLVGGLINLLTSAHLERRRDAADVRQARRLVAAEVLSIYNQFGNLIEARAFPGATLARELLPNSAWEANRATLARHLDDHDWDRLAIVMGTLPWTRSILIREPTGSPIPDDLLEVLGTGRELLAQNYKALSGGQSLT